MPQLLFSTSRNSFCCTSPPKVEPSLSLEDHLEHLHKVVCKLMEAGLKLKPSKCHFVRGEVEYFGFLVTRNTD